MVESGRISTMQLCIFAYQGLPAFRDVLYISSHTFVVETNVENHYSNNFIQNWLIDVFYQENKMASLFHIYVFVKLNVILQ